MLGDEASVVPFLHPDIHGLHPDIHGLGYPGRKHSLQGNADTIGSAA